MIIDTSAVVEIALGGVDGEKYLKAIVNAPTRFMSAVNLYEAAVVVYSKRRDPEAVVRLYELLKILRVEIVPFDSRDATAAAAAYIAFGKGVHPAKLNLSDCPAYALAKREKLPLLFKGEDFIHTNVRPATVPR